MARTKKQPEPTTMSVAVAVSDAVSELTSLGEEMRNWADNIEEKFGGTDKYSRIDEAATTLEGADEPDVPDWANNAEVQIRVLPPRKRGYSRADRCSQACYILDECMQACQSRLEELGDDESVQEERDEVDAFHDAIESIKEEAEAVEFPGMYG